ncbi:MAG: L-threonylcarbamoyladenylate synthase [Dehalococcoidales bacterium]|nr:L-threonylcarbamoyladenylate synthase [Dehalococcoidales bacterium]
MMLAKPFTYIQQQIERGVTILRQGGLIAYPTDTVYGLGASMSLPQSVARIYEVKGRPRSLPLPLLLADVSQIAEVASKVPPSAWCFINSFFPGALTLILPKAASVPAILTGGGNSVAVRVPDHPVPLALIRGLGAPIVGTSANISGRPSPLTAEEVYAQLGDKVDLIIDGGRCPGGKESTIVDVTGEIPVIRREGAISIEELRRVCGNILTGKENS